MNWTIVGIVITLIITVAGWAFTFGICKNKIDQNNTNIVKLENKHKDDFNLIIQKQNNTDVLLQSINTQLTELNTKMSLLLRGKINVEGVTNAG